MIKEIDVEEYRQNDIFPAKTKKEILEYSNIGILNDGNSWELYKYFLADENGVRRIIKKGKDLCMITTLDKNNQSHIDIIQYGEKDEVLALTRIDSREAGFDYRYQMKSNYDAIVLYEKHGDSVIETRFTPSSTLLLFPIIEVSKKPHHTVSYLFEDDLKNPTEVSLIKYGSYINYKKDKKGLYYPQDVGFIRYLKHIIRGNKSITLQEVEKELNVTYPLTDRLLSILQEAMDGNLGLKPPEELQESLNEVSIKNYMPDTDKHTPNSILVQDRINNNGQADNTKSSINIPNAGRNIVITFIIGTSLLGVAITIIKKKK